jgi:hypothetical protein
MDTALSLLVWVDQFAARIEIQDLPPYARHKNRVILEFRGPYSSVLRTVGARTLPQAIAKANLSPAFQPPGKPRVYAGYGPPGSKS